MDIFSYNHSWICKCTIWNLKNVSETTIHFTHLTEEVRGQSTQLVACYRSKTVLMDRNVQPKWKHDFVSTACLFWSCLSGQCEVIQQPICHMASTAVQAVSTVSHSWRPGKLSGCCRKPPLSQWECAWRTHRTEINIQRVSFWKKQACLQKRPCLFSVLSE